MADIKRLNYFNSQFLVDSDFNDEQAYHLGMRRRHNRTLHTWGVADGGLVVTKTGAKLVSIGSGMAIDKDGQEIVLLDTQTVDFSAFSANADVYVTIQYRDVQDPADHYTSGGVDNYTRWTERPLVQATATQPPTDGSVIPLAKVHLDGSGNVTTPDQSIRPVASSKIDPGSSLQLGSLTVSGNASVGGRVGIGTTNPGAKLDVINANASAIRALSNAVGSYTSYQLGRTGVDSNWGVAAAAGQWAADSAPGDVILRTEATSQRLILNSGAGASTLVVNNGNIGIGVSSPTRKLEIAGSTGTLLWAGASAGSTANIELSGHVQLREFGTAGLAYLQARDDTSNRDIGLRIRTQKAGATAPSVSEAVTIDASGDVSINSPGTLSFGAQTRQMINLWRGGYGIGVQSSTQYFRTDSNFAWYKGGSHNDATLNAGGGTVQMVIQDGNVGIGTSTPGYKLDVADRIRLRQGPSGSAGIWFFQSTPNAERAFVGMAGDNSVGFYGVPIGWGLQVDTNTGNVWIRGSITATGKGGYVMDQFVNKVGETLEQGDIVVIGDNQASQYYGQNNNIPIPEVDLAQRVYDTRVCGIVTEVYVPVAPESSEISSAGTQVKKSKTAQARSKTDAKRQSFTPEELEKLDRTKVESEQIGWMVTLGAFAHCKVDADIAPIKVGDLLTTSPTRGHAQKVLDRSQASGAIVGKALGSLEAGKGKIPVLVMLQ